MKIGTQVYMLDNGKVHVGVIVSKARRWDPLPRMEYIVREVKDLGSVGIAGVLSAAFSGNPDSLTMHTSETLYKVAPQPEASEEESA